MNLDLQSVMIAIGAFLTGFGCMAVWRMYLDEKNREKSIFQENGEAKLEVRLEYDKDSGAVYYTIQNTGTATAHDVRIYLPKCHEIASSKKGMSSAEIAAGIMKVMHKRYDRMMSGELVEIPLVQIPATDESRKSVYGLGLDVEMRWSNAQGDITSKEMILPVFSRNTTRIRSGIVATA